MRKITSLLSLLFMMMGGVNLWAQLPQGLELTTNQETPIFYFIKSVRTNSNSAIYLRYNGDNANITRVATVEAAGPDCYWYFMAGSTDNTVKIYNFNGKALASESSFTTEGKDWYVQVNKHVEGAVTISDAAEVTSGNHCLDANNSNSGVGRWNSTAGDKEGTAWNLVKTEAPDFSEAIKTLANKVNKADLINKNADATFVGYLDEAQKNALNQAIQEATGKTSYADYVKFEEAVKSVLAPNFEDGAYYLIEHQNNKGSKKYPSTQHMHSKKDGVYGVEDNNDRVIRRVTADSPLLPRLWKFEKQGNGGYKIRSANTDCVWSSYIDGIDMPINKQAGGSYSVEFIPCNAVAEGVASFNTKFSLKIGGHMINAFQGDGNNTLRDYNGNHIGDKGNWWSFKKVTTIPVTIGTTGWASMALPFAVSLPEGVTAYIATACKNDVLTLSEVKGIIPANTGFLLTGAANTYNLTITTGEAANNVEGNLLKGATCKRLGFAEGETFGLGVSGDKAVFMKNALKDEAKGSKGYVPANKAYILTTDLGAASQAASMLQFNFGGEATGIDGVVADDAKETIYYDLNGRRVLYPTQGVYVTNTGKKVFIR